MLHGQMRGKYAILGNYVPELDETAAARLALP
jgi:hypothetical protein